MGCLPSCFPGICKDVFLELSCGPLRRLWPRQGSQPDSVSSGCVFSAPLTHHEGHCVESIPRHGIPFSDLTAWCIERLGAGSSHHWPAAEPGLQLRPPLPSFQLQDIWPRSWAEVVLPLRTPGLIIEGAGVNYLSGDTGRWSLLPAELEGLLASNPVPLLCNQGNTHCWEWRREERNQGYRRLTCRRDSGGTQRTGSVWLNGYGCLFLMRRAALSPCPDFPLMMNHDLELWVELNVFFPNLLFARIFYHSSRDKSRTVSKKELCRKSVIKWHTGLRTGEGQVSRAFLGICISPSFLKQRKKSSRHSKYTKHSKAVSGKGEWKTTTQSLSWRLQRWLWGNVYSMRANKSPERKTKHGGKMLSPGHVELLSIWAREQGFVGRQFPGSAHKGNESRLRPAKLGHTASGGHVQETWGEWQALKQDFGATFQSCMSMLHSALSVGWPMPPQLARRSSN